MRDPASDNEGTGRIRFWLLTGGVVLASLAGYLGYFAFPRFDLPAGVGAGLLVLAQEPGWRPFSPRAPSPSSSPC